MDNILVLGASSAMAQASIKLLTNSGKNVIAVSTKEKANLEANEWHTVTNYEPVNLPKLEVELNGFIYFPGTIALKPFGRFTLEEFENDMRINTFCGATALQTYLPNLKKGIDPNAIFFSTVAAKVGMPFHSSIAMAKGALEGLVKSLAAELAPTIRVNAIAPSLTQTPLADKLLNTPEKMESSAQRHPLKKVGTTDNMAQAVLFLLNNNWVTGQILGIDGGMGAVK